MSPQRAPQASVALFAGARVLTGVAVRAPDHAGVLGLSWELMSDEDNFSFRKETASELMASFSRANTVRNIGSTDRGEAASQPTPDPLWVHPVSLAHKSGRLLRK